MAESAATHAIYFMAAIVMAVAVIGVLNSSVQDVTTAASGNSRMLADQMRTDIAIISDPEEIPNSKIFYVKNIGTKTLDGALTDIIVNGVYISENDMNKSVIGRSDLVWKGTDVLQIEIDTPAPSGDNKIKIITQNGVSDEMEFTI
ncbi:MAG: hypothetical protein SVY15_04320 [Halobacteriota archaeon]|nr:hypothetical protein [Halobacteriota archaeon]MDY6958643.1 hypothetical protein [Halobacteriota archaeon]